MRTAICLIAFVLAKSNSSGGLTDSSANYVAIVTTVCMIMDIVDFIVNIYYKTQK